MASKPISWINSTVLLEAIIRYEQGSLPKSMRLWLEDLLELKQEKNNSVLPRIHTSV